MYILLDWLCKQENRFTGKSVKLFKLKVTHHRLLWIKNDMSLGVGTFWAEK